MDCFLLTLYYLVSANLCHLCDHDFTKKVSLLSRATLFYGYYVKCLISMLQAININTFTPYSLVSTPVVVNGLNYWSFQLFRTLLLV